MKKFKCLKGMRLLLDLPTLTDSKLIVDNNTKESLEKEMLEKMSKLKVFAVGDTVTDIKKGDSVLVDPSSLKSAKLIPFGIDAEGNEVRKALINYFDIIIVW